jgi:hypothetical protein
MEVDTKNQELIENILSSLRSLEYDVTLRNRYMNERDRYIYGDGLWETLDIPDGFDKTKYNYLKPTVEIHTSQFMGRGFNVFSQFDKEDIEIIEENDQLPDDQKQQELKLAKMRNAKRKADADQRKQILEAIVMDNGGMGVFKHGAKIGSSYGETVFKVWPDFDEKKVKISLIESPQNWRPFWADSNFRERDADGYVYQISTSWASRLYGDVLPPEAVFQTTQAGFPLSNRSQGNTSDPLDQKSTDGFPQQTEQEMVTVVDFTGYREGWGVDKKGNLVKVKPGKEKPFSVLIVGGFVVETTTEEKKLPKYYRLPNKLVPQRAFGESDIDDSLLQINATIMERMSDWITVANKTLFPLIQAKGFETADVPTKQSRTMKVVAMDQDQSLDPVNMPNNFGFDYKQIISTLEDAYVRVARIGRVLFDDPTINPTSNQALMTTLKGVIDVVEAKQAIWEPVLVEMFTDMLHMAALVQPTLKDLVKSDDNWRLRIEWPNVLRREDQVYRTMWLNELNAGTISLDTYQEKIGIISPSEEIDRMRDNMKDPVTAAVLGKSLPMLASQTINKAAGIPPWGYVVPKVSLRGEMTPNQEANMADHFGFNDGPYPPSAGPQGNQGDAANQNLVNEGFLTGNPFDGGMPIQATPPQQGGGQTPQVAQGDNVAQPMSQPGSGAPAVSPAGATATTAQNHGA